MVPGRQPGLVAFAVHTATTGIPPATVGRSLPASAGPGLVISRTLPPAFSGQVVSVTVAADGTISLALNSGVTVLVGSDADRTAKYKDIAAILANGTLHATSTIDVTCSGVSDGERLTATLRSRAGGNRGRRRIGRVWTVLDQVLR